MPWATPTLREVRGVVRDYIRASLPGADASIPNSVLRVLSDNQGALCHLTLQYVDWLALQLLPDTAETEWLDRHGEIWLVNADGSIGRKVATFATGTAIFESIAAGVTVPAGTELTATAPGLGANVGYETLTEFIIGAAPTEAAVRALDAGTIGNLPAGTAMTLVNQIGEFEVTVTAGTLAGGTDTETDEYLRARVLLRIQQPPMGGAAHDYVNWTLAVPGVTRAWCYPLEMGIGTVTVRFMMDELRAANQGFPTGADVQAVAAYLETVRPVAVKDVFVVAPIPRRVDVYINDLSPDTPAIRAGIEQSLIDMMFRLAAPGQTIYAAWKYQAIMNTPGVVSFNLRIATDDVMPSPGHMGVLGDIVYAITAP
jgi:uncharacterized phage protein gp47/JayE